MTWIVVIGVALRVLLMATTGGTSDLGLWEEFARAVGQYGITGAYAHTVRLNHPPLGALVAYGLASIGPLSITLRAFCAVCDIATALIVSGIARRLGANRKLAAALFFLSPVAILTSSFYCNTDSLLVTLLTASILLTLDRRHAAAGVVFACACGVKVVPMLALPLLLIAGRTRFAAGFSAAMAVIFVPAFARDPLHFIGNVLAYAGSGEMWGLALPGTLAGAAGTFLHVPALRAAGYALGDVYIKAGRLFILAAVAIVTWIWSRNPRAERLPAAVTLCFLGAITAAPRVTLGYFLWFLPMLPFALPRRVAIAVNAIASLQLCVDYTLYSHGFPWTFADLGTPTNPWWLGRAVDVAGLPLWLMCIFAFVTGARALAHDVSHS